MVQPALAIIALVLVTVGLIGTSNRDEKNTDKKIW